MDVYLDVNPKQLVEHVEANFLPAEIEMNAVANVNEYFNIYKRSSKAHLTNSLRGFPLDGIEIEVPLNLKGVVFQEFPRTLDRCDRPGKILRVTGTFKNFTYWNYDKVPSAADGFRQALEVFVVADELLKPISADAISSQIDKNLKAEIHKHDI